MTDVWASDLDKDFEVVYKLLDDTDEEGQESSVSSTIVCNDSEVKPCKSPSEDLCVSKPAMYNQTV